MSSSEPTAGLEAIRTLVAMDPDTKVIALGLTESEQEVIAYAEAGASAYLPSVKEIEPNITTGALYDGRFVDPIIVARSARADVM